jgi:hypothetical protein
MALTALNRPREGAWHSGKASPSARDLALGEGLFPVRSVPDRPSPSVAPGEAAISCSGLVSLCESTWQIHRVWSPSVNPLGRFIGGMPNGPADMQIHQWHAHEVHLPRTELLHDPEADTCPMLNLIPSGCIWTTHYCQPRNQEVVLYFESPRYGTKLHGLIFPNPVRCEFIKFSSCVWLSAMLLAYVLK